MLMSHTVVCDGVVNTPRRDPVRVPDCFLSVYAVCRLTWLSVAHGLGHVALQTRLYLKAVRQAFDELQLLNAA